MNNLRIIGTERNNFRIMNIKLSLYHSIQLRLLHTTCRPLQCNSATLPKPAVLGLNLKAQGRALRAEVMAINFG